MNFTFFVYKIFGFGMLMLWEWVAPGRKCEILYLVDVKNLVSKVCWECILESYEAPTLTRLFAKMTQCRLHMSDTGHCFDQMWVSVLQSARENSMGSLFSVFMLTYHSFRFKFNSNLKQIENQVVCTNILFWIVLLLG